MAIVRQPWWEDGLRTYLDRMAEEPFKWGENDCALFAAGAIRAQTGIDLGEPYRNRYTDEAGAALALREVGQGTLLKTLTFWLGPSKAPALAHRGDIVMMDRTTTGVCVGHFSAFVGRDQGAERMIWLPTRDCKRAFTIPYQVTPAK